MPLDQEARKYADTLFGKEVERLNDQRQAKIREIKSDHARRGMIQSGGYINAIAGTSVEYTENVGGARIETLIAAYDRAALPFDQTAELEMAELLQPICAAERVIQSVFDHGAVGVKTIPDSAEKAIRERIARECSVVFSRLRRDVGLKVQERALDLRRAAAEVPGKGGINEAVDARNVFVVHGRDQKLRVAMFSFLQAIGLHPMEWAEAIRMTGSATPYVGDILHAAFSHAKAVVVLLTPDDEARLRSELHEPGEQSYERNLTPQARPNVLFEAGMALARHPTRTVLVEVGMLRPFSDVAGRHMVRLDNSVSKRTDLVTRLESAGCDVKLVGTDWQDVGDFTAPETAKPAAVPRKDMHSSKPEKEER